VFPLPSVVLFPGATMQLRLFELRYRTMLRDALAGERLFAIAPLAPGWEQDYHGSPAFERVGCIARIEQAEWLPNDHYDLRVKGFRRVVFTRTLREFPYRACAVDVLGDAPYTEDDPLAQVARTDLLRERERLAPLAGEVWYAPPLFAEGASLTEVAGAIATAVRLPVGDKLAMLTEDRVIERARVLCEHLRRLGPGAAQGH
jgi:Lon protease-like protein